MGWSIGYDDHWQRDIGYGVPAICDHPGCDAEIDRGMAYVCGGKPYGGDNGCGLYFCGEHLLYDQYQSCERCVDHADPFTPKPDAPEWVRFKLADESWQLWRDENPTEVAQLKAQLQAQDGATSNG